jgi:hypothetical protein
MQNLHDKYDGLAQSVANQDPLNKLSVGWHNVSEEIGNFLLPIVQTVVDWILNKLIPAFQILFAWLKDQWPELHDILRGPFDGLKQSFDHLGQTIDQIFGSDGKSGKMGGAKLGTIALMVQAEQLAITMQILSASIQYVATVVSFVWSGFTFLAGALEGPMVRAVLTLEGAFAGMAKTVLGIASSIYKAFIDAFNWIADAWNATLGKISVHIPGTNITWDVPDLPHAPGGHAAGTQAAGGAGGSVINVNLPSGTDGHAIVAALRTYDVRVGGLDLAVRATR